MSEAEHWGFTSAAAERAGRAACGRIAVMCNMRDLFVAVMQGVYGKAQKQLYNASLIITDAEIEALADHYYAESGWRKDIEHNLAEVLMHGRQP